MRSASGLNGGQYLLGVITPLLNQDVKDKATLVDCPPEPVAFALDLQLHLIQVPFVTQACTPSTQSSGVGRAEFSSTKRESSRT